MNKAEVAKLLVVASMVDSRIVAPETVEAWHDILGDLDYETAREGMNLFRRESDAYLMPSHIIDAYDRIIKKRKGQIFNAARAGLIPKDWPETKALTPAILEAAAEHWADRGYPSNDAEYDGHALVASEVSHEGRYDEWVADGMPWRKRAKELLSRAPLTVAETSNYGDVGKRA